MVIASVQELPEDYVSEKALDLAAERFGMAIENLRLTLLSSQAVELTILSIWNSASRIS